MYFTLNCLDTFTNSRKHLLTALLNAFTFFTFALVGPVSVLTVFYVLSETVNYLRSGIMPFAISKAWYIGRPPLADEQSISVNKSM